MTLLADEVSRALLAHGIPQAHAGVIGARAEAEATHNATLSRWPACQVATAYLTREVQVSPDRERMFERAAAVALLADASLLSAGGGAARSGSRGDFATS